MTAARRILVVDDDPASCDLVAYFLKSLGHRVAIAPDGNRALNVGSEGDIELVILDEHLPIYDGITVADAVPARMNKSWSSRAAVEQLMAMRRMGLCRGPGT